MLVWIMKKYVYYIRALMAVEIFGGQDRAKLVYSPYPPKTELDSFGYLCINVVTFFMNVNKKRIRKCIVKQKQ